MLNPRKRRNTRATNVTPEAVQEDVVESAPATRQRYFSPPVKETGAESRNVIFARRLNQALLKRGWRQADLHRAIQPLLRPGESFEKQLISPYCRGVNIPYPKNLDLLARALDIDPRDLVPDSAGKWVGEEEDSVKLTINGEGRAHIKLDMVVSAETALRIAQIIREDQNG